MAKPTVSVGCKLPHGLHLDIGDRRVTLNGLNTTEIIGGHGVTRNVDKEFFDAWMALNADNLAVKNGFIFAETQDASLKDRASDMKDRKTGFEGIDGDKPGPGIERVGK